MGDLGRGTHSPVSTTKFAASTATPKIMSATIRLAGLARARDSFSANIRTPKQAIAIRLSEKSIKICRGIAIALQHENAVFDDWIGECQCALLLVKTSRRNGIIKI